jgi:transposase-like protein
MISEQRSAVHSLAQRLSSVRTDYDKTAIRRHAEAIFNIANRNEYKLSLKIMTRRTVQRCPQRMQWVRERHDWKLIQDDCKLIVEILEGLGVGA